MMCQQAENSVESKVNTTHFDTISLPVDRTFLSLPRIVSESSKIHNFNNKWYVNKQKNSVESKVNKHILTLFLACYKTFDSLPRSCVRIFKDLQILHQMVCQQAGK